MPKSCNTVCPRPESCDVLRALMSVAPNLCCDKTKNGGTCTRVTKWKLIYIMQWLVLCVNLVGLWSPIVCSNNTRDATVKDFSDVTSTYHQPTLRLLPVLWVGLTHLFTGFRSKGWDLLKKKEFCLKITTEKFYLCFQSDSLSERF